MTLDKFTKAYIDCLLWASVDDDETPLDEVCQGLDDFSDEAIERIKADCERFQNENSEDIDEDLSQAGHDFWLTRNGHGAGFWDGDWKKDVADRLTRAAEKFGRINAYLGDDDKIYLE